MSRDENGLIGERRGLGCRGGCGRFFMVPIDSLAAVLAMAAVRNRHEWEVHAYVQQPVDISSHAFSMPQRQRHRK